MIDLENAVGSTERGFFHEQLVSVLGEGSFDHGNAENRWTTFLQSNSRIAKESKEEYYRAKEITQALIDRIDWGDQEPYKSKVFEVPLEGFGFATKKLHKEIMDERHALTAQLLEQRATMLPRGDKRRMAFFCKQGLPICENNSYWTSSSLSKVLTVEVVSHNRPSLWTSHPHA
jgi:hypothetical protein